MRVPLLLLCLVACSGPGTSKREVCGNGIDDDGNGKTDCDDVDCAGQAQCPLPDAGFFGTCPKCGQACVKQTDCLTTNILDERPLPSCNLENKCELLNQSVSVRVEYEAAAWQVTSGILGVITTRWVSKTGRDGGSVTCADVKAAAPANNDPAQLEDAGRFTMLGFDVTELQGTSVPNPVIVPFAYVGTGTNYMLYTEVYSGDTDSRTRLPTGSRRPMTGCIETGPWVTPIDAGLSCTNDGGTCRTLRPSLPPPS